MITLELEEGIYYLKEKGKTIMTLHYGYSLRESPEEKAKRLNVNINPKMWGSTKRVIELHMNRTELLIGLNDKKESEG